MFSGGVAFPFPASSFLFFEVMFDSEALRFDEEEAPNTSGILRGVGSSGRGRRSDAGGGVNVSLATCNCIFGCRSTSLPYIKISVVSGPPRVIAKLWYESKRENILLSPSATRTPKFVLPSAEMVFKQNRFSK